MKIQINDNGRFEDTIVTVCAEFSSFDEAAAFAKRVRQVEFDMPQPEPVLPQIVDRQVPMHWPGGVNDLREPVLAMSRQGTRKIEAIKFLRHLTGLGLKEAKYQVEAWLDGVN